MLAAPGVQPCRYRLPLPKLLVDEPIDDVRYAPLDLARSVGDDALLELLLDTRAVDEIEDPAEAQGVVEVLMPAPFHVEQDLLHAAHPQLESTTEVSAILIELPVDVFERRAIAGEQAEALVGRREIAPREDVTDTKRALQLQPEAALLVERVAEIALERFESARAPHSWLALLGTRRKTGADREDRRTRPQRRLRRVANERQHLLELGFLREDVDLVHDDDDLLAPGADGLDERALGFGKGTIGGRHEEDEIGARYEVGGQALVLAQNRVRARRVDDVEILEEVDRGRDLPDAAFDDLDTAGGAVADQVNLRGGRRHAFFENARPEQGVDERALAGVELTDDDEEKELVELAD